MLSQSLREPAGAGPKLPRSERVLQAIELALPVTPDIGNRPQLPGLDRDTHALVAAGLIRLARFGRFATRMGITRSGLAVFPHLPMVVGDVDRQGARTTSLDSARSKSLP
jgi:hypothetical protein